MIVIQEQMCGRGDIWDKLWERQFSQLHIEATKASSCQAEEHTEQKNMACEGTVCIEKHSMFQ